MIKAGLTLNQSDIAFRIKQTLTSALLIALTWVGVLAGATATTSAASITIGAPAPSAGNAVAIPVTINNVATGNFLAFVSVPANTGTLAVATATGVTSVFGYDATTFQRSGGRELGFTGTIAQVKAALDTLTFTPATGNFDVDLAVSISEAPSGANASNIYYFPDNGHYYEYVTQADAISWNTARDAAADLTLFGRSGYLVTITSAAEQDFVASQINAPNIWIGASDEFSVINAALDSTRYADQTASEGQWYWVTGPEAGTQFWKPAADGQQRRQTNGGLPVGGEFSAWCSGEPNNSGTNEHYGAANFACGSATPTDDLGFPYNWNDFSISNSSVKSYLVEYGGLPNETSTAISADATACLEVSGSDVSGCNTITIVGTGGSALGAGWGFQSGVITATQDIDINASEVVGYLTSGDLTIDAGRVVVATAVTSTSANDLTLRARNDVQVDGVITTAGGSVVLWANSAGADTGGGILFELDAGVTTAGGHIWMGGSAALDGSTIWNGLTVGDGYAVSGTTVPTPVAGTASWLAAVSFKRNSIESGGGDIRVYGRSNENNGIGVSTHRQVTFNAGSGQILIEGINEQPDSRNGFLWGMHSSNIGGDSSAVNISSSYSGNGYAVTLTARHGNSSRPVAGLNEVRLNATGEAGVYIQSINAAGGTGLQLGAAEILAAGGDIVIETAASTLDAGTATLGFKSGSAITTSSSDITIIANTLTNLGTLNNNTTGALTIRPVAGDSFSSALNTDSIKYSAGISGLTLGGVGNTSLVSINSNLNIAGDISVYAGQIVVDDNLTASTGSITLDADTGSQLSFSGSGIVVNSNKALTANNGTIALKGRGGDSGSPLGVVISAGAKLNTTSGAITITGVGGNGSGDGNHGVQLGPSSAPSAQIKTTGGDIVITGTGGGTGASKNNDGISARLVDISSGAGAITLNGGEAHRDSSDQRTTSSESVAFDGVVTLGHPTEQSGNITIIGDVFWFPTSSDARQIRTSGSVVFESPGAAFASPITFRSIELNSNTAALRIGKATNTANLTLDSAVSVAGPITMHGGNIAISATTTAASNINLHASGAVTQSAAITAQGLGLNGSGSFTLQNAGNTVGVIAGGTSAARLGSVSYLNNGDLGIGTVNPTGIYASGAVLIETETGDIAVTQPINSTLGSGTAIELNAGKSKEVGDGTGGDILVSGDGAISIQSGAVASLFSGSPDNSTGLSAQADEVLVFYDETNAPPSSAFSAGNVYAIYRTTTSTQLTIATQPSATAASGVALATQPTVSITDAFGNAIRTDNTSTIQVEIFSGDNGTLLGTQQATVVNGVAEFADLAIRGPVGTSYRLRFSGLGLFAASSTEVALTAPGPVDLVVSSISADPVGNLTADGTTTSAVVVTVADTYGNPIAGEAVVLTLNNSNGRTLAASTGTTNAMGQFATTLASTVAGSTVVSAYRGSSASANLIGTVSVGFLAGAPTQLEVVSGNAQTSEVAEVLANPLIVRVRDAQDNLVAGASVVFAGDGTTTPTSGVAVSNAEGIAEITWALGEAAGTQTMTATLAGSDPEVTVSFSATAEPGPPAQFAVVPASSRQLTTIPFALEVVLQDVYGNRTVADSNLTVALTSTNVSAAAGLDGAVAGVLALEASPTVAIGDQTLSAGQNTISLPAVVYSGLSALDAETPDIELTATASFGGETLTGKGLINARNIYLLITATPEVITADGVETSLLTTQLKDLDDEIVPNQPVRFANTRGLLLDATTLEPLSDPVVIQADANGQAQVRLRAGTVAQTATATAVSRGADPVSVEIEFEAGPPAKVVFSKVDNSTQLGPQLRSLPFAVKVAFFDALDNPTTHTGDAAELVLTARTLNAGQGGAEAGELRWANQTPTTPVSLSVPSGTSSLIFTDVLYTGLSGALVGQDVVLTATGTGGLSGLSMDSQGFSVRDIKMTIVAANDSLVADGANQTEITVTLTDADDVAQPGQNITAETSLGTLLVDGTALSNPLITDANGQVRFVLRTGTVAGEATVTARCPGACPVSTVVVFVGNVAGLVDELSDPTTQPTTELYEDAGITGVDTTNLPLVNDLIAALPASDKTTPEQLQASVDALNKVLSKADGNASTTPDLDADDYKALGLPGIANGPASGIDLMNSVIANQDSIDSYADLVELADVIERISQTLVGQRPNAMLTPDDFALVGITGVDYSNRSLVIWALNAADPSQITSLSALQALIDEVPPPLPVPTLQLYGLLLLALLMLMMGLRARRRV